jgi:ACS family glucarate transporter-like MFS transporter
MHGEPPTAAVGRPSRVHYQVLAALSLLAYLTYVNRNSFAVAFADPGVQRDLGLEQQQVSYLIAAFLFAYGLCQVPGGLLGDRFGSRHLLTVLALGWSLLSGLTALAATLPRDTTLTLIGGLTVPLLFLLLLRFVFGLFQAAEFPTLSRVVGDWMPIRERGLAQGLIWTLSRLGGATVPFLFWGMVVLFDTWTTPFWIMAASGILWCAFFWPWFRNRPEQMSRVNADECRLIAAGRVEKVRVEKVSGTLSAAGHIPALDTLAAAERVPDTFLTPADPFSMRFPWRRFLGCRNVWTLCLVYSLASFSGNFYTGMIAVYLRSYRGLEGLAYSTVVALPLAAGILPCLVGGMLSDWIFRRWGSRRWARRVIGMIGTAMAGVFTLLIPFTGDVWMLGIVVGLAFAFSDLNMGPAWAACVDVGERYAGTVSGTMNMSNAFAGAIGAVFTGYMLGSGQPEWLFVVFAGSYLLAAAGWLLVDVSKPMLSAEKVSGEKVSGTLSAAGRISAVETVVAAERVPDTFSAPATRS